MVLIISTFKVANGMEAAVRQAFLDRPGLVDDAPGFLGMEVATDQCDGSIFHLLTRWTDQASFQRWHSGPLHKLAHRGIPKGLKLDASHTVIRTLDLLEGDANHSAEPPVVMVPEFLARTRSVHWLRASFDGAIAAANPAFELLFREEGGRLTGQILWDLVTHADAESLQSILNAGNPAADPFMLVNFVDRDHQVHTLDCHLDRRAADFILLGEPVREDDQSLARELLEMNNQWAVLVRENEKNARALRQAKEELEKALTELNESHWHLRKIQETLPICMYCGKVKTGDAQWEGVVEYLKANSLFLTHGCCPTCLEQMAARG